MNSKGFNRKITMTYDRIIKSSYAIKYKAVYSWEGNLYATNGYAIYMVKGNPSDCEFKSEIVNDNTLENMVRPHLNAYHTSFYPPTIEELKAYIKERGYSRVKGKLLQAKYKLENGIYVNAFFLLDALELCKSKPFEWAKGFWSGEISYCGTDKQYFVSKGVIEIVSADGNNAAWIMPIKAPRNY